MLQPTQNVTRARYVIDKPSYSRPPRERFLTVSQRLTALRRALGYDGHGGKTRWVKHLLGQDALLSRYTNWEKGSPLPNHIALKIITLHPGVSMDWLYRGIEDQLSVDILRKLETLPLGDNEAAGDDEAS
jgi:hypothetical protein